MDNLIYFGDAVKALGEGKVGGYLVRWGDPNTPDLTGDYFTKETDLGVEPESRLPVYYDHGYDPYFKHKKIGKGIVTFDNAGVWFEAQLEMRDEYERSIYKLAEAGKLGWSSGAAGHLVEREPAGKAWHIKSWVIAEASLTPTPAEPRNAAISIKSLYEKQDEELPADNPPVQEIKSEPETENHEEEIIMSDEVKSKSTPDIDIGQVVEDAISQALKKYEESKPQVKAGTLVTRDEADQPMTGGEFFKAVKNFEVEHYEDPRLKPYKASGLNEAVPSQGGFLLPEEFANTVHQAMWGTGRVLSFFNPIRVSRNNLTIPAIDETSRATGSRMGGVRGYWLAEGAQKTSSYPKLRHIKMELKKVAALVYASDELLADSSALESWITNNVPNELRFMVEDAIIDGDGVGKPLGILQSNAVYQVTRTDDDEVDAYDIGRMWAARYTGVNDYVWFINPGVFPQLLNLTIGQMPVYLPAGGVAGLPYGTIFGRPVVETEYQDVLGTAGDILLASPSQYALITKGGVESASSIHVKFDYDETCFRFVYRVDGQPLWASKILNFDGSTYSSPFVTLASST